MAKGTKGIAVAGTLIADTFYKIDTYPDAGNLTNIRDIVSYIGGTGNMLLDLGEDGSFGAAEGQWADRG